MLSFPFQIRLGLNPKFMFALTVSLLIPPTFFAAAPIAPDSPNHAKNLARMNCGAQIECTTPDGHTARVSRAIKQDADTAALIMDDDTISCPLEEGETNFVVALPKASLLDRFTFLNENATACGQLTIAVSNYRLPAKSPKWTPVEGTIAFSHKRHFDLSLLGIEAKFVKLSFRVEKHGRIAAVGLYGQESLGEFANRQSHIMLVSNLLPTRSLADTVNFNFANLYAKAHIVYVSSGTIFAAQRMIDDDAYTGFQFAASDSHPTTVVELAARARLRRVSAIYQMRSGRLDIYLLDRMFTDAKDLAGHTPVASIVDSGNGKAAIDFNPRGARYVALRWTPGPETNAASGFDIAEINAFGDVPLSILNMDEAPTLFANIKAPTGPGGILPPIDPPIIPFISH